MVRENDNAIKSILPFLTLAWVIFVPTEIMAARLVLQTVDVDSKNPVPCLVRLKVKGETARSISTKFLNRGTGLPQNHPSRQWLCFPGTGEFEQVTGNLSVEAFAGPEYEVVKENLLIDEEVDLHVKLHLKRIADPGKYGWRSGNTHLHLNTISRAQADEYLRTVPASDGLELVFVSNLRRAKDEKSYVTNEHRTDDLKELSTPDLKFGWGQEHRHNYGSHGQGYGHVMLLNIKRLIRPVSIGSGIMGKGTDYPSLQRGIRKARAQDATVVWCHNAFGLEDIPNWFSGTLDAQNIFDGGGRGSYEDTFYRYLNVGLRVPFSTGTDWFIYDFSRVYAKVEGEFNQRTWLQALRQGRSYITNGPLLELNCGERGIGDVIAIDKPQKLKFSGQGLAQNDFGKLQILHNGKVVKETSSKAENGHFRAELEWEWNVNSPSWIALRVQSGHATIPANAPTRPRAKGVNVFGQGLFAHTSPIYVDYSGKRVFHKETAQKLVKEMESDLDEILKKSNFAGDPEKMEVLRVYEEGIRNLEKQIATRQ